MSLSPHAPALVEAWIAASRARVPGLECLRMANSVGNTLQLKRMGIDTHEEPVVYIRADCHVCRSKGVSAYSRVAVLAESAGELAYA